MVLRSRLRTVKRSERVAMTLRRHLSPIKKGARHPRERPSDPRLRRDSFPNAKRAQIFDHLFDALGFASVRSFEVSPSVTHFDHQFNVGPHVADGSHVQRVIEGSNVIRTRPV